MMKRAALAVLLALLLISCGQCPPPPDPEYVIVQVCPVTHLRAIAACPPAIPEQFLKGHEPADCRHVMVRLCVGTALLANEYCPAWVDTAQLPEDLPGPCTTHKAPPVIPVCASPWPETGKLRIWSGTLLGGLSTKDNATFKESDLPAYYDALAEDGPNAERNFCYFEDDGAWTSYKPNDPDYYQHLTYRINLAVARKITEILVVTPYGMTNSDDEVRAIIRATKKFLPYIIYEAVNEPTNNARQSEIVAVLQAEGIPNKNIQIDYVDSGAFSDLLSVTLDGKGLACLHWCGTMDTINAPWPAGWAESEGTLALMKIGLYGSNDGQDFARAARGLNLWAHEQMVPPVTEYRRGDNVQSADVCHWMLANGPGWEWLSFAGFQRSATPHLADAISIGRAERQAMRR